MVRCFRPQIARIAFGMFAACLAVETASAQSSKAADGPIEEIIVRATASRIPSNLTSVPGSVTIISAAEVAKQTNFSTDLGDMLGRLVPGLAPNSGGSYNNFDQTLRGRKPMVFIDGVPASIATRDGGRDFRLISPGAIGRVDVISGATALYGLGAGGGLINYATKEPNEGPVQFTTEFGVGSSLASPGSGLNYSFDQSVSGKIDRISFVGSGYFESKGGLFGADGHRIPPDPQNMGGTADTKTYDIFLKLGFDITDNQRIFISGNYYKTKQDTDYIAANGVYGVSPSPAVKGIIDPRAQDNYTKNWMTTVRYTHDNILGSALNIQGYYSDYGMMSVFSKDSYPPQNGVNTTGGQTEILSRRSGIRADLNTPLNLGMGPGNVLWGVDYQHERPLQALTDGRVWVPPLISDSIAPFAQFEMPIASWLTARGGVRYDHTSFEVPTFRVLTVTAAAPRGNIVSGGKVSFSKAVANFGVVTSPIATGPLEGYSFYAGFSQGYAIGDFGRALRATPAKSVTDFGFKADVINSYELGLRADYGDVKAKAAVYYSESTYGSTYNAITYQLTRAPEKIWGMELQVDAKFSDTWNGGATFSINTGKTKNTATGVWSPLDTSRISPGKLTTYLEHSFNDRWAMRAQYLYSMREDKFSTNVNSFGRHAIEAYGLLDVSVSGKVGPGKLTFAVNNVLNERYFTPDSWRYVHDDTFTLGEGATARLTYSLKY